MAIRRGQEIHHLRDKQNPKVSAQPSSHPTRSTATVAMTPVDNDYHVENAKQPRNAEIKAVPNS